MTLSGLPRWRTPCVSLTQSQMVNLLNWYQIGPISKSRKKMDKKMQMNSFGQFLSLCCFVRHSCMCSKREKMKHSPSEEKLFLGLFRQSPKRTKKIHPKSKWTFFAGLLGCSTWQQVSASGTEEKRRKMRKKKKNSFFAYSKLWKESLKQIHQNSKWAFFAGLLGCCTWQQVSASGTEGIRREMCQKKKNPSLQLVNCGKKVWKQFTKNTKSVLFPPVFTFFYLLRGKDERQQFWADLPEK